MISSDVIELYKNLDVLGIKIWIDGGFGVNALLEQETRYHKDLDITTQEKDVLKLRRFLKEQGYKEIRPEDAKPHNFILGDNNGHEVGCPRYCFR
jgi:lincosamide nucleotidyltransferase A/C/D/E